MLSKLLVKKSPVPAGNGSPNQTGAGVLTGAPPRTPPTETLLVQLLERTVQHIGTIFGRLSYLTTLRDPVSGRYRHAMFVKVLDQKEMDRTIRAMHFKVFYTWLSLSLAQQRGDLVRYLGHETREDDLVLRQLRDSRALFDLAPGEAATQEKLLFESNLMLVINTILFEFDGATVGWGGTPYRPSGAA